MERNKHCVETRIGERFGLKVTVNNKPSKGFDGEVKHVRVDKWWISIETAPENPAMPRQKIKLEIANIPAYTRELTPLRINYDFLGGMPTVLANAESLDEITADKVLAFPTSLLDNAGKPVGPDSAKIRHRDIWDLAWMATRGAKLVPGLVAVKIGDYGVVNYPGLLDQAIKQLPAIVKSREFKAQMSRFIDSTTLAKTVANDGYNDYLTTSVGSLFAQMRTALANTSIEMLAAPYTKEGPEPTAKLAPKRKQASSLDR